jgi:hypothetical protein
MVRAARDAFLRFGRGRGHPARLNMGDCMAYAVARSRLGVKGGVSWEPGAEVVSMEPNVRVRRE